MSRIGKKAIALPKGVTASVDGQTVKVKGPKGFYRKVKLSRIALRDLANFGQIPGMTKASW